jgi:NADPH-dependent 2,4-dienoyl-CoA reductase/sulfur reductase-like enzyme/nitrite reductase/ring-hydroxylating ferredoxin subunit
MMAARSQDRSRDVAAESKVEGPDFTEGVSLAEVKAKGHLSGHVGKEPVLVAVVGDEVLAIGGKCTHYGGPLGKGLIDGDSVHCPWHHACFSLRTGEALQAPAFDPVPRWRVEQSGDRITIREKLPKAAPAPRATGKPGERFLIVGGGAAGFAAAERLRREGFGGEVAILSRDPDLPVDRPNLSKDFLAGKAPEDWVFIKSAGFFKDHDIRLELDTTVAALDTKAHEVVLADGRRLGYAKLLLATGAEPVRLPIPGGDGDRVFTLRSLADSRAIIAAAAGSESAVVIGASFIGLEVAASLRERGLRVEVVAPEQRPLEKVLGPELGDVVRAKHEAKGVVFHLGRKPKAIEDGAVLLDDGQRLRADLVVMGVGVRPRIRIAEAAGLSVDHGVVVDSRLRTSDPDVFAAGDIARFPYALPGGGTARIEHWVVAERQGQVAALNMLGRDVEYADAPFFWSQHYDLTINYVGHGTGWDGTETSGTAGKDFLVKYLKAGRLVAAATIHRDKDSLGAALDLERQA